MSDSWRPYADYNSIKLRAEVLGKIRQFMLEQNILEVETPVLAHAPVTELQIASFSTDFVSLQQDSNVSLYLQTSPEYAMKRLLASGSGAIYQISKVFRNEEQGKLHNPEFSLLEWYQPACDHHQLIESLALLLQALEMNDHEKIAYGELFAEHTGLDPHSCETSTLASLAKDYGLSSNTDERTVLLDFIFSHKIASTLGMSAPLFVYDYPACQCALAKLSSSIPPIAERFELFINGMEIANGFHELTDADEQLQRFQQDLALRKKFNRDDVPIDDYLLDALKQGLPDCAGVAVGIDRLLMAMTGSKDIQDVLTFPIDRA